MKKILLFIFLLSGCTSTPGVIPVGDDTYSIMITGQSGFIGVGGMKADAYVIAQKYCTKQNKFLKESDYKQTSGFGKFPEVELKFMCVDTPTKQASNPVEKPKTSATTQSNEDMYTELKKLKELLDAKIITQEEFNTKKKAILNKKETK